MNPCSNRTFQTIADTFRAGCVAVVNRSTNVEALEAVSISEQLGRESDFFLHFSGMNAFLSGPPPQQLSSQTCDVSPEVDCCVTLNELGQSCLGLPALMSRIDTIIR